MQISVIIPTYNRAPFLKRSLDSVFNQSLKPKEVILVDDASTDDTPKVANSYGNNLKYLKLEKNKGVSGARNEGIRQAKFEWLAFLDSDDEWHLSKLQKQKEELVKTNHMLCHTQEVWMRNGLILNQKKKHQKHSGSVYEHCLPLCFISPSTSIIHKSVFDDIGLFKEDFPVCEDYDLWLRICSKYEIALVDEPQINKYGGHDDQLSFKFKAMDFWRIKALKERLDDPNLLEKYKEPTLAEIHKKYEILKKGYLKHNRLDELKVLNTLLKIN